MSENIDRILNTIDAGLEDNVIFLPQDRIRALEDEVWAELSEWHDHDEAVRRFLGWRATHKAIVIDFPERGPDPGPNAA